MKERMKNMWIGAGNVLTTVMSFTAAMLFSSKKAAREIREMSKHTDVNRKAFVLGNGPSLKEVLETPLLLKELEDGDVIVTNRFAISEEFPKLKPRYYILMDPFFFKDENIQKDKESLVMFDALNNADWDIVFFIPTSTDLTDVLKYINNPHLRFQRFNGTRIRGPVKFQNRMYRKGLGIPSSRNVIIPAMELMINLGYKNVYLYGAEFSWTKTYDVDPRTNKLFMNDGHFYKTNNIIYQDPVYTYEKGYFKWSLEAIAEMLAGTEQVALFAESMGVKMVNRTKGSFIDAFPYENPDTIFDNN